METTIFFFRCHTQKHQVLIFQYFLHVALKHQEWPGDEATVSPYIYRLQRWYYGYIISQEVLGVHAILLNLVSNQDWFEFHGNLIRDRKISGP